MNQTQKEASFTVKKTTFLKVLKQLKTNVVNKRYRLRCTCEITVIDGYVSLNVPGATFGINAQTSGTAKASVQLNTLTEIIKSYSLKELRFKIQPGRIVVERFAANASTTFFENDKILRSIILPMNFNDMDLLAISASSKYTVEELKFNNLWISVNHAEGRLKNNIDYAAKRLKEYGITRQEIEQLANKRIELNIKSVNRSYNFQKDAQGAKSKLFESSYETIYSETKMIGENIVPLGCYYDPYDRYKAFEERLRDSVFPGLEKVEIALQDTFSIGPDDISYEARVSGGWAEKNIHLNHIEELTEQYLTKRGDDDFDLNIVVNCKKQISPNEVHVWGTVIDIIYEKDAWYDRMKDEYFPVWVISIGDVSTTIDTPFTAEDFQKIKQAIIDHTRKEYDEYIIESG